MSPTQPLGTSQESMNPDQRLDLLLQEHEQKQREDVAAAALARIRQEQASSSMHANQCHPNRQASSQASSSMHTNQRRPNGQASSSSGHAMTQCHPNGQASQTIVANNSVPFDSVSSLNANAQACHPNGQAGCHPNGHAIHMQHWQHQTWHQHQLPLAPFGSHAAMPPLALGGSAAAGQVLTDQALAEQRSEQQRAARRRSMDDHSWIHASTLEHASHSWTPQKQSLAREIHELRLTNKDQSRELARALERSQQLEVSLTASNRAHCDFEC